MLVRLEVWKHLIKCGAESLFWRLRPAFQPGQSSSLLWMARQDLSATGEGPWAPWRREGLGEILSLFLFPGNAPSPSVVENQYKQSLGCDYLKKKKSKWSNPAFRFLEGRKRCKTVQPDVSSNRMAGASAVSLEKDFPVSSSWTVSLVIGFPFI